MYNVDELTVQYQAMEKRIVSFITEHSGVEYVENSEKVVEGGIFGWAKLNSEDAPLQMKLRLDYVMISEMARERLEWADSKHLIDFDRSSETVLSYIRHDSMLWVPSLEAAAHAAKIELDLQRFLLAQTLDKEHTNDSAGVSGG
ncbi:hypothetical protein [Paenibacillus tepidiphilus]|uniref:hypothetical protein n=1 Tax=Paenibacillus tepidiphilus TaxID=2608683 RepID=UPI00123C3D22|nr:hypothetical protein [Paenibacillus tepidiphilus]